ncbi:beta strand repeat-containing protein [Clostridium beijerinckii]|uniref:beta strand repeat-containing protein n=1 Tax=Clostridium beijerinckii TaxID=1520 RepID=UPI000809C84A|nr:hypothetical protein [Clostridium beijerinckii]OCA99379.1 hypothetical protein BGS1_09040 [Clostridium beijerinckii]
MYNVSDSYKTFIKKPSRSFECRITLGNRVFNNSDIIQIVPTVVQPSDRFSIGNTVSQSIDITLKNDGAAYASIGEIKVEIGLKINNSIEYIPFGTFNIDDVSKTAYTVKLTCYDNMVKFETGYFSKLGNTPTLQEVVNELAAITGVEFTGTVPNYVVTKLEGYTCREVLAYVASVCGGNAYITRDNKFTIIYPHEVDCTITADNYFSTGYKLEDQAYKIGMITCQNKSNSDNDSSESDDYDSVNDKNTISVGDLSSDSMELTFENPWVTQSILNDIYNKLKNFSYLGYTLKWQGDLSLDPLDIVTLVDKNNVTRKALVFANKLTYNGGLSAETSAKGETKNSNSFSASGSTNKNIERLYVKLLIAEKAIINKASIADLQANSARIDKLDTNVATINTALIDYANISNATIADLVATKATVSDLTASVANIDSALINKANIADLTAANATISNLSADLANVKTLINGNLTSANIQSLVLTSSKVTVDNGFIKNAMIESLDATKINTGSLNTSKISVTSSDGSLLIAGATQQFKDKNGKVRIQMGQDAQGNFNFILVASDGTTTLIDGTGVKANAIADKLIKANMVADSAIGEQQINYSSFVTGFNKATNTSYINASKVAINLTGQTLDVAFNNINTKVDGVKTTTDTNTTSISAIQGQISTLISNTTITNTDGTTTQLKDAYNATVNTINSMKTSIGELTTDIDANTKNITSVTSRTSTLETNLSSISASLSSTKSTVDTHTTQISTANTNITTALNNASSAVNTANTANTTANTAKTTATTASTNASNAVTTANSASSNASTALTNSNTAISTANTASTKASNAVSTANKASTDVATLTTTVTNTVSRVSSLELTTSGLTTRVGNTETSISSLSIGGRNLLIGMGSSVYTLIGDGTGTAEKVAITNYYVNLVAGNTYTFSCKTDGLWGAGVGVDTVEAYLLKDKAYTKFYSMNTNPKTFTCDTTGTYYLRFDINKNNVTHTFWNVKIEQGTVSTSWSLAPEDVDSSIAAVKDYATQTINSNVSTINQTTDSIKASVSSLQSSVSTINTTLGNKADKTTVTSVTNRVSTLETGVNGINASITTLKSNVSSVTNTVNSIQIGGRNLLRNSGTFTIDSARKTGWTNSGFTITKDADTNYYIAYCSKTGLTSNAWNGIYSSLIPINKSDIITISFDMKVVDLTTWDIQAPVILELYNSSGSRVGWHDTYMAENIVETKSTLTSNSWCRVSITVNMSSQSFGFLTGSSWTNVSAFGIRLALSKNGAIYFRCAKIEYGNQSTDWSPAPEDVDSQITTINSSVSSLQSSVFVLQNQIALKVEQSNIDSAVSTLNGKINSTNATISSMQSSINLQLNNITSSVSQTVSTKNLINNPAFNNPLGSYNSVNNIPTNCSIANTSAITGWGFAAPPVCDNALHIRFDATGDNYIEFSNLFAKLKPSTTYTLSYYYTMNGNSGETCEYTGPSSFIYERTASQWNQITFTTPTGIGPDSVPNRSTWKRYSRTFTTQSTTDSIMLRFGFHQTHSSSWCEMLITGIQLELGSTATNWVNSTTSAVGTSITQSPVDVMTAFNNISSYFKVNKDGATFGDTNTGDYTVLGANGMKHHVGGTDYDYMYITYVMDASVNIISETYTVGDGSNYNYASPYDNIESHMHSYFVPYDSTFKKMLGGRIPKHIMVRNSVQLSSPARPADWNKTTRPYSYGSFSYNGLATGYGQPINLICDENGITVKYIQGIYMQVDRYDNYDYKMSSTCTMITGGSVGIRFLIFA